MNDNVITSDCEIATIRGRMFISIDDLIIAMLKGAKTREILKIVESLEKLK